MDQCRRLLLTAVCLACAWGAPAPAQEMETIEMRLSSGEIRYYVRYKGIRYLLVAPQDLKNVKYDNQRVCFETKFDHRLNERPTLFVVEDKSLRIHYQPEHEQVVSSLLLGDNVWLGGLAREMRGQNRCGLVLHEAKKLKSDFPLFDSRFDRLRAVGNSGGLIQLGHQIKHLGKINPIISPRKRGLYRLRQEKAFNHALRLRKKALTDDDAAGYYDLALQYRELLPGSIMVKHMLLKCVGINPAHSQAGKLLRELGYMKYKNQWVTPEKLAGIKARERQEKERAAAGNKSGGEKSGTNGQRAGAVKTGSDDPAAAGSGGNADTGAPRPDWLQIPNVTLTFEQVEQARADVFANAGSTVSLEKLRAFMTNPSLEVRKDVADALAFRGRYAREFLERIIDRDPDASVRKHAVDALAWLARRDQNDQDMGALIERLAFVRDDLRTHVTNALRNLTGQTLGHDVNAWRAWWEQQDHSSWKPAQPQ